MIAWILSSQRCTRQDPSRWGSFAVNTDIKKCRRRKPAALRISEDRLHQMCPAMACSNQFGAAVSSICKSTGGIVVD